MTRLLRATAQAAAGLGFGACLLWLYEAWAWRHVKPGLTWGA